jgi:hypothetical protein
MASMIFDLPLLDNDTTFILWQVKMHAVLAHTDLHDALDEFTKDSKTWTDEEKQKDQLYIDSTASIQ